MPTPQTVYANIVNVKITGNELIFEFGAEFPPATPAPTGRPEAFTPEVRIVLGLPALKAFADLLQKAVVQLESTSSRTPQQPEPTGNRPTSKQ
jgi:hypothetical protein